MSQPVEAFRNAMKIPELKQRIIFTLIILAVYRIGVVVPMPGIDGPALAQKMGGGSMLGLYNLFSGGALEQASIFSLGIMPYITVSIIISLLVAVIPSLEKLAKEGAEGQKKINEFTRYGTVVLSIIQSIGVAFMIQNMNTGGGPRIAPEPSLGYYLMCIITFTAGAVFIMWLGEQISEHGIGNGISLIIFVNIVSRMPQALSSIVELWRNGDLDIIRILIMALLLTVVVAGVIMVIQGQRRVPIQYPRQVKGRKMFQGSRNYLPLRVNQAGVIPIIFASSILMLPTSLAGAIGIPAVQNIVQHIGPGTILHGVLYALLIVFFTYFYTAVTFNPIEIADNLKKYGGVVMGVRPGKATADYLNRVMIRITVVGALFLAIVALLPEMVFYMLKIYDYQISSFFGGTSLLILVGVALDTVRQIEQHLVMRNYEGFMKGRRFRGRRA
ncbi:MAG: preprotein translocase subunit SecY [FCB group bacterium]|nr:preprotein translocase subunit SecY [FCB group bacterium]